MFKCSDSSYLKPKGAYSRSQITRACNLLKVRYPEYEHYIDLFYTVCNEHLWLWSYFMEMFPRFVLACEHGTVPVVRRLSKYICDEHPLLFENAFEFDFE